MQFDNISKCYRMIKIILQYKALINCQCLQNPKFLYIQFMGTNNNVSIVHMGLILPNCGLFLWPLKNGETILKKFPLPRGDLGLSSLSLLLL